MEAVAGLVSGAVAEMTPRDVTVIDEPKRYPESANHTATITAKQSGYIKSINAYKIGHLSCQSKLISL